MSLSGLISGSECAVPANPLSQVLKHTEGDRSVQQLHHLPGTSAAAASEHDLAMARHFFETNRQGPSAGPMFGAPPHLPPAEMARMGEISGRGGPDLHEAWARDQQQQFRAYEDAQNAWIAEFGSGGQHSLPGGSAQQNMSSRPEFQQQQQRPSYMGSSGMYGSSMAMYGMGAGQGILHMAPGFLAEGKGKGKMKDADFEAAFAQVAESFGPTERETARIVEVDDTTSQLEEAMQKAALDDKVGADEASTDFSKIWEQLQDSELPPPKEDIAKWEAEFNQLMSSKREDLDHDYGSEMQQAWESGLGNYEDSGFTGDAPLKFDDEGLPILSEYVFEPNNKYMALDSSLDAAKAVLENHGSLSEAALLLEAAIQKGELGEGGYEAWILLGETRNMDEREDAGMRALAEGVRRAQAAGANGAGMLSLAISYTNESFDRASHTMLLRWLQARFPSHPIPESTIQAVSRNSAWDTHDRIQDAYLSLARTQHSQGIMDPDVQIGLGVLFYTNQEYDRAKDCFESALSARPKDYLLWNRLGSSLSNGSKPEEALGAYREALNLRPTYTRAIYNVGVACLNIGAHKEAAEHFLSALQLQEATAGETSEQLWFTLRRVLLTMNRSDLAELAKPQAHTNLEVFRKEGFEF
ncbi:hypothetical protein PLICRDRAFT_103768 [Plicaturopsis crispa FD-325 SS-3]|nr:hypothetical protein PLICRDRAFT_103768 [Plicaturopsis crispa FD-325 SS-3]